MITVRVHRVFVWNLTLRNTSELPEERIHTGNEFNSIQQNCSLGKVLAVLSLSKIMDQNIKNAYVPFKYKDFYI